jgi:hypothetical protein
LKLLLAMLLGEHVCSALADCCCCICCSAEHQLLVSRRPTIERVDARTPIIELFREESQDHRDIQQLRDAGDFWTSHVCAATRLPLDKQFKESA